MTSLTPAKVSQLGCLVPHLTRLAASSCEGARQFAFRAGSTVEYRKNSAEGLLSL